MRALLLAFASVLPLLAALLYFVVLADSSAAPLIYGLSKAVQFSLPLLALSFPWRPTRRVSAQRAMLWGLVVGALLAGTIVVCAPLLLDAAATRVLNTAIGIKLSTFGLTSRARYLAGAVLLSVVHSALEEYYWRWFVYGGMRRFLTCKSSAYVSSIAFAAHHAVVVGVFLGPERWLLALAGTVGVAAAGVVWCRLYSRTGRLSAPWLAHVLADVAVLALGYFWTYGGA